MGRNFHNVHVHAPTARKRDGVVKAVLAHAKKAGFERVKRVADADRVIRLGGRAPWFSIEDDGYEASAIASAVSKATKLPTLEAYCEASAIVWLALHANGRRAGGWAEPGKRGPAAKLVDPILAKGTAKDVAAKWDEGIRQVFPESALALVAKQFGLAVGQLFGDTNLRAVTIALRRKTKAWTPRYHKGAPSFSIGWGSNQGWGPRHLVFVEDVVEHRVQVTSTGGAGKGIAITFGGDAIGNGHIEILECSHEKLKLERDGNTWRDPDAVIPAGLIEQPDVFSMSRREASRAREVAWEVEWYVDVKYRAIKEGECKLTANIAGDKGSADLMVHWRPWCPSVALSRDNHGLFAMHRSEHAIAQIALNGSLADAWPWARKQIEQWTTLRGDDYLRVTREFNVILDEGGAFDRVAETFPSPTTPLQVAGKSYLFGTAAYAPFKMEPDDKLAVQLILVSYDRECEHPELAMLEAICDDAIASGFASSAIVYRHQYQPSDTKTRWEELCVHDDGPLKLASWQSAHVRGIDKRLWLAEALAVHVDRSKLPDYATVTPLARGIRLRIPDTRMRMELEPLISALGALTPTQAEVEQWSHSRSHTPTK